jgi:hypothetical protein
MEMVKKMMPLYILKLIAGIDVDGIPLKKKLPNNASIFDKSQQKPEKTMEVILA